MIENDDLNSEQGNTQYQFATHYLDNPSNMTRFQSKLLLQAMRDPEYVTYGNRFDWNRFAYEFTTPDFDPPLDTLRLFDFVLTPHFSRSWRYLPRDRVWWLIRLVMDVPYPLFWLQKRQLQGHRGEMSRLAEKLNCFAITAQSLSYYLTRHRPDVPKQFQIVDMPLLVLLETQPSSVWGIEHRLFKTRLVKKVAFCEPLDQQSFGCVSNESSWKSEAFLIK
jgi:hypothetical protein